MNVRKTALLAIVALLGSSVTALCDCFAADEHPHNQKEQHQHHSSNHEPANQIDCEQDDCDDCVANHSLRPQAEFAVVSVVNSAFLADEKPSQDLISRPDEHWLGTWQPPPEFVLVANATLPHTSPVTRADTLLE